MYNYLYSYSWHEYCIITINYWLNYFGNVDCLPCVVLISYVHQFFHMTAFSHLGELCKANSLLPHDCILSFWLIMQCQPFSST